MVTLRIKEELFLREETLHNLQIENPHLKKLYLTKIVGGSIEAFSDDLSKFNLESLSIFRSRICLCDARTIANLISESKLSALKLTKSSVEDGALRIILSAINQSCLNKLNLERFRIGKDEANAIIDAMQSTRSHLIKLSFIKCTFEDNGLTLMLHAIKQSSVRTLILELLDFDNEETLALTNCVSTVELIKLSLDGSTFDEDCQEALVAAMKDSSLKQLYVRSITLFPHINEAIDFRLNSKIEQINFYEYNFTPEETLMLAKLTKQNSHIKNIFLRHVHFTDKNLAKVCDLLKNSSLTNLSLSYCHLSDTQLRTIIKSIEGSSISSLNLERNYLSTDEISAICDLLENHDLKKLNLSAVVLTEEMLRTMLPSLKKSTLVKLNMGWRSKISVDIQYEIKEILRKQREVIHRFSGTKSARAICIDALT